MVRLKPSMRHVRVALLAVVVIGLIAGPFLIWQALRERSLAHSVAHARPCAGGVAHSDCIAAKTGIVASVIWPYAQPGYGGAALNNPGTGNVEPQLIVRLADGRSIRLDIGFGYVPKVGTRVTAFYYGGYLLRASDARGRPVATIWEPGKWEFHVLLGLLFVAIALLALGHRLYASRRRWSSRAAPA
jgi:hypothetical protein